MWRRTALAACALTACDNALPDQGSELLMRVPGEQLVRQPLPSPSGGPETTFIDVGPRTVIPGEAHKLVQGRAGGDAYVVNIALAGEDAHWVLPVLTEDPAVPGELTWATAIDFSRRLASRDSITLEFQSVGGNGETGEVSQLQLAVEDGAPDGELVIELLWDAPVDLDLYVVDPDGVELSPKNINTYSPPGPGSPPDDPDAWQEGGIIDFDSNANCAIDGRQREYAVWQQPPPAGEYEVFVDLASACGQQRSSFWVSTAGAASFDGAGSVYALDAEETAQSGAAPLYVGKFSVP